LRAQLEWIAGETKHSLLEYELLTAFVASALAGPALAKA
jgi:hypothetical protein